MRAGLLSEIGRRAYDERVRERDRKFGMAMGNITVTTMDNGLRIATDRIDTVETVSLGCWVGVGTRHEPQDVSGVAHLCEHMMFKGTERRSALAITKDIERVGGQINAFTTREMTAYYVRMLADDAPLGLDVISDMLLHSRFDDAEIDNARTVVLQEIAYAADMPDNAIFDHFHAAAYPDQGLGRAVLGSAASVTDIGRLDIVDYVNRRYVPSNMVLVAAGRIEHQQMVDLAGSLFDGLPSGTKAISEPTRYRGGDIRNARDLEQLHLMLGFNNVSLHDPDFYAYSVLATLLGGGMSSRLFQEVREKRGLVYSISSFLINYLDGGLFGIHASTTTNQVQELIPVLCHEIGRLAQDIEEDELVSARTLIKASMLMALEDTMSRCHHLAQQLLVYGRPIPTQEWIDKFNAVDLDAVKAASCALGRSALTVAAIGPMNNMHAYDAIAARFQ